MYNFLMCTYSILRKILREETIIAPFQEWTDNSYKSEIAKSWYWLEKYIESYGNYYISIKPIMFEANCV